MYIGIVFSLSIRVWNSFHWMWNSWKSIRVFSLSIRVWNEYEEDVAPDTALCLVYL